jgi:hypothetical protein
MIGSPELFVARSNSGATEDPRMFLAMPSEMGAQEVSLRAHSILPSGVPGDYSIHNALVMMRG